MKYYTKEQFDLDVSILKMGWTYMFALLSGMAIMGLLWLGYAHSSFGSSDPSWWNVLILCSWFVIGVVGMIFVGICVKSFYLLFIYIPDYKKKVE